MCKKSIFKVFVFATAMTGAIVLSSCSHDDATYSPEEVQQAKAQAELAKKKAAYQSDFVKTFGPIASGHQWGFDQTRTRGSVTKDTEHEWFIPEAFRNPTVNKEGIKANTIEDNISNLKTTLSDFNFNSYLLQHVEKPDHHNTVGELQAYDNNAKDWVPVAGFTNSNNPKASFECANMNSYIGHRALSYTTLMANMGANEEPGTKKQFRFKQDGEWCYDYFFFEYKGSTFLCLKRYYAKKGETSWWIIRICEANIVNTGNKFEGRVFCEDMGEIGDYDFNDLVMDVVCDKNNNIDITIVAAGGTLPIYIGGQDAEHGGKLVTIGQMANTGKNKMVSTQKMQFAAKADGSAQFASIRDIPIWVNPGGEALPYELEAKPNEAPQKICTFLDTAYPDEYVRIDRAYTDFADWVKTATPDTWSEHLKWWLVDLNLDNNSDTEPITDDNDD